MQATLGATAFQSDAGRPGPFLAYTAAIVLVVCGPCAGAAQRTVSTTAELETTIAASKPGDVVRLLPGEYVLNRSLQVPDGVSLTGDGRMAVDSSGFPSGMDPASAPTIRAADSLAADLVQLGNRTSLRGLRVVVPDKLVEGQRVPSGNAVALVSRRPADRVAAEIRNTEIVTGSPYGANADGPNGRGIMLATRNPVAEPSHVGAQLRLKVDYCLVRAPYGNALFANNFAAEGVVILDVRRSAVEGMTNVSGGTGRPDPVNGARTIFRSKDTRYYRNGDDLDRYGWQIYAGTGIPNPSVGTTASGPVHVETRVDSSGDRIEGFRVAVMAAGHRRVADFSTAGADNRLELRMHDTIIQSTGDGAVDLSLHGAISESAPRGSLVLSPGERNVVRAELVRVHGSGPRANVYSNRTLPGSTTDGDDGNRVAITGSARAFAKSNPSLLPPPPTAAFEATP